MNGSAILTSGISKSFGSVRALDNISVDVAPGEIYGLLGPDGAGKTTLFRILTTLMLPDSGTGSVWGHDLLSGCSAIRRLAGYMPGRFSLYPDLSVEENLRFYASLFGCKVADNFGLIEPVYNQIAPFRRRRAADLSGGMKQKLALCCALIHKPAILFLDEPTTGVDAVSRSEFWDILGRIKATGMPVMVSTPYMDEASRCDRISLMDRGRILETGTVGSIIKRNAMPLLAVKGTDNYATLQAVRRLDCVSVAFLAGEWIHVFLREGMAGEFPASLPGVVAVKRIDPRIEDVFIKIMGDGER